MTTKAEISEIPSSGKRGAMRGKNDWQWREQNRLSPSA